MFSIFSKKIPTFIRLQQVFRYAKYVRKSKEEIREELESSRLKVVKDSIASAMKQKKCLSVSDWKSLTAQFNKNYLLALRNECVNRLVFSALLALPPPIDLLSNARNFIEASNLSYDLNVKWKFVEMYSKKHAIDKLTDEEEKELIELLVLYPSQYSMKIHVKKPNYIVFFFSSSSFHLDVMNLSQAISTSFQKCIKLSHKVCALQKNGKRR